MAQKMAPRTWFTPRQTQFLEVVTQEKDLATEKFEDILTHPKAQDYIDLYLQLKRQQIKLKQLRRWHWQKFKIGIDPLNIATAFLKVNEFIPSRPKMIRFFEALADSLKPEIFT